MTMKMLGTLVLGSVAIAAMVMFSPPPVKASSCSVVSPSGITCRTVNDGSGGGSTWFDIVASGWATGQINHTIVLNGSWTISGGPQEDCDASVSCGASCNCTGDSCACYEWEAGNSVFCEWWVLNNGNWELDGYYEEC